MPCPIFFILCYLLLFFAGTWAVFNLIWQLWIVSKAINVCAFICIAQLIPQGRARSAGGSLGRSIPALMAKEPTLLRVSRGKQNLWW